MLKSIQSKTGGRLISPWLLVAHNCLKIESFQKQHVDFLHVSGPDYLFTTIYLQTRCLLGAALCSDPTCILMAFSVRLPFIHAIPYRTSNPVLCKTLFHRFHHISSFVGFKILLQTMNKSILHRASWTKIRIVSSIHLFLTWSRFCAHCPDTRERGSDTPSRFCKTNRELIRNPPPYSPILK